MRHFVGVIGMLALLLGVAYLYSVSAVRAIERDYPPSGEFVIVEGVRLHYVEAGQGEPIVLIHGASANLWDFASSIAPRLAKTHRVIAFDRPGYGYSDRPAGAWVDPAHQARLLSKALVKLGIERPTVVGHSVGGAVALAFALDYPQLTAGVALIGGAAYPWEGGVDWTNHVATWPVLGSIFVSACVVPAAKLMLEGSIGEVFAPNTPTADYVQRTRVELTLRRDAFRASAEDVLRLSTYLERQSQRYESLTMPLLLITGDDDRIVPAWNHAERLAALLSHARLVELERTGHASHHVHVERVADLIAKQRTSAL